MVDNSYVHSNECVNLQEARHLSQYELVLTLHPSLAIG